VGQEPDTVRGRQLGPVRAGPGGAGRAARGPTPVVVGGHGLRADEVRHTDVRGPVARPAPGRRPVPRAPLLRTAGRNRAVPGHGERGQGAPVDGRRAVRERVAYRLVLRRQGGWLRDHVRAAHRAAGQERWSHGAVRPTGLGPRHDRPVHVRQAI